MRCYYCGVAITPPDGYPGEVPGVARGQGIEVALQAGGAGPGRVDDGFVLCPLCHHMLRTSGWGLPADDQTEDGMWIPLLPTAPARAQVGSGRDRPAPLDGLLSAPLGGLRSARGGRPQMPVARHRARGRTGNH